ncbi:P27 family phage terminase small subunit [Pseudolysinimonas sp.]
MSEFVVPSAPVELGERGTRFWDALHRDFEFEVRDTEIVREACRVLDRIDELEGALEEEGLLSAGSKGQTVLHPAVAELRQQQSTFRQLMGSVELPGDDEARDAFRHQRAKAGAEARWGVRAVANG